MMAGMMPQMMPQMMPGMMGMPGAMMTPGMAADESSDESPRTSAPASGVAPAVPTPVVAVPVPEQTKISSSASCVRKVPRCHLAKALAQLCPVLDVSWTADLSAAGLMGLLYILTSEFV